MLCIKAQSHKNVIELYRINTYERKNQLQPSEPKQSATLRRIFTLIFLSER